MQSVAKKGKSKKSKKPVKQIQQKLGFQVNLDQEQPQIPESKVDEFEEGFKVIQVIHTQAERDEPPPEQKPQFIEDSKQQASNVESIPPSSTQQNLIGASKKQSQQYNYVIQQTPPEQLKEEQLPSDEPVLVPQEEIPDHSLQRQQHTRSKQEQISHEENKLQSNSSQAPKAEVTEDEDIGIAPAFAEKKVKRESKNKNKNEKIKPKPKPTSPAIQLKLDIEQQVEHQNQIVPHSHMEPQQKEEAPLEQTNNFQEVQNEVNENEEPKKNTNVSEQQWNQKQGQNIEEKQIMQMVVSFENKQYHFRQEQEQIQQKSINWSQKQQNEKQQPTNIVSQQIKEPPPQVADIQLAPLQKSANKPAVKKVKKGKKKDAKAKKVPGLIGGPLMEEPVFEQQDIQSEKINQDPIKQDQIDFKPFEEQKYSVDYRENDLRQYEPIPQYPQHPAMEQEPNFNQHLAVQDTQIQQIEYPQANQHLQDENIFPSSQITAKTIQQKIEEKQDTIEKSQPEQIGQLKLSTSVAAPKKKTVTKKTQKDKKTVKKPLPQLNVETTIEQIPIEQKQPSVDQTPEVPKQSIEFVEQANHYETQKKQESIAPDVEMPVEEQNQSMNNVYIPRQIPYASAIVPEIIQEKQQKKGEDTKFADRAPEQAVVEQQKINVQKDKQLQIESTLIQVNIGQIKKAAKKGTTKGRGKKTNQQKTKQLTIQTKQLNFQEPDMQQTIKIKQPSTTQRQLLTEPQQTEKKQGQSKFSADCEILNSNYTVPVDISDDAVDERREEKQQQFVPEQPQPQMAKVEDFVSIEPLATEADEINECKSNPVLEPIYAPIKEQDPQPQPQHQEVQELYFPQELSKPNTKSTKKLNKKGADKKKEKSTVKTKSLFNTVLDDAIQETKPQIISRQEPISTQEVKIQSSQQQPPEIENIAFSGAQQLQPQVENNFESKANYKENQKDISCQNSDRKIATQSKINKSQALSQLVGLIRFRGNQELKANRQRLKMLEQDICSRLLRKKDVKSVAVGCEDRADKSLKEKYNIYSKIIDEHIALREELKNKKVDI